MTNQYYRCKCVIHVFINKMIALESFSTLEAPSARPEKTAQTIFWLPNENLTMCSTDLALSFIK